ncbi:TPA: hypothetical protein R6W23_003173 [Citrobacter gillenii]|nr:hypothetical protein [Citrobacter gillenii]
MSKWKIPNKNPWQESEKFPLNIMLIISCAIFLFFITYNIFSWLQDNKVPDCLIWNAIGIPSLIVLAIWCVVVITYGVISFPCYYAGYLEQYGMNKWKNWAKQALPLLDYSSILPVPELALKIQKLEGEAPAGSATPLRIDIEVDSMDDVRVENVLRQLIEPLKKSLVRDYRPFNTWLYVKGADDTIGNSFKAVLASLSIPNDKVGKINILDECPDYFLINGWIDLNNSENNLVITIELHDESDSDFFESANAFIFTNTKLLADKDTPLYLLRMMDSTPYYLDEIVSTYLSAQQVDVSKIKKLWFNSLDKQSKFVLFSGIESATTSILADSRYELEAVTGKSSEVQRWVILALAADAAKYGQGHQLFASTSADTIQSGIIAAKYPGCCPALDKLDFHDYWRIIKLCAITLWCIGFVSLVPLELFKSHPGYTFIPLVIGILVIYTAVMIFSFILTHNIEQKMNIYYSQFL